MGCPSSKSANAGANQPVPRTRIIGKAASEGSVPEAVAPAGYRYRHHSRLRDAIAQEVFPQFKPQDVAAYYNFPQGLGVGQKVGIISLGGKVTLEQLRENFARLAARPGADMPAVKLVDVGSISPEQDHAEIFETLLDVEVIGSICPQAEITIYRGSNNAYGFAAAVHQGIDDSDTVLSISWGGPEGPWSSTDPLVAAFERAVKAGVTVCCSTGDSGSSCQNDASGNVTDAPDFRAHVDFPASCPHVLACGGTQLERDEPENVWNNSAAGGGATGGGVSDDFELPSWQAKAGISIRSANPEKNTGRIIPDVAGMAASGDWVIFRNGKPMRIGGTSAVAPLWAALITLANEKRAANGKGPVGFVNEVLYE
eukprot:TRINITY_DN995_c0_g1_i3.p1 TRINITY_DN995_c0_g1~~TRINITY_DN995_c0_g1_i3.p1  ORF type:complete len:383 (-),score=42.42 TRINITY_DN995_c0_g1_i3:292-1398(-)